jgi:hypothetical protein
VPERGHCTHLTSRYMSGRSRDRTCDHLLVREVLYR